MLSMFLTGYFVFIVLVWLMLSIYLLRPASKLEYLRDQDAHMQEFPPVVMIVPVRDEEEHVRNALSSMLQLDYPNFRILAINDRSTDGTADALAALALTDHRVTVLTIETLPEGWLGKNHALYQGVKNSIEPFILFTDADVHYRPLALKRAMQLMLSRRLDHLTLLPEVASRSKLLNSILNTFALMLELKIKPWEASDPKSEASFGAGAFNLVRRSCYEAIGTHQVIRMRPDDDLKLGEYIKRNGFRQQVLYGWHEVYLEWYPSVSAFISGLMKNTFSVSNYNFALATLSAIATLIIFALPLPLIVLSIVGGYGLFPLLLIPTQVLLFKLKPGIKGRWYDAITVSLAGFIMAYILLASAIRTLLQGGVYWRGTFYSLKLLKEIHS